MPPLTEATTSTASTTYATGGYIYTPINTSYTSAPVHVSFERTEDKIKEYTEKVDKHVDELEEDIDYFNQKLEQQQEQVVGLEEKNNLNLNMNIEQDKKIKALEDKIDFLENYTNYLEGRIMALEDKTNDKMS